MSLHVPTIFVALFLSCALFVAALSFTRPLLGAGAELQLWIRSAWLLLASFIALFSRVVLPEWIAILLGNAMVFASLHLMNRALHRFVAGHEPPRWQRRIMFAGWLCTALLLGSPLAVRTIFISGFYAAQLAPMVWLLATRGWHAEASLRTVCITLALACAALVIRTINAALFPEDFAGYFQTSLGNGITYLASFLFPVGAGFGFVLANLERTAQRLNALATHDSMTGCLNRGAFDALLSNALQRVRRGAAPASLIVLDVDNFKQINDTYGHPSGDMVLTALARALRGRLRAADAFGRLGGDEFAVLLVDTDMALALNVAEAMRAAADALELCTPEGERLHVTISIGISCATADRAVTVEALHAEADKSLYAAKQGGRNRAMRHGSDPAASPSDRDALAAG